jgi:hypothetical protein
MKNTNIDPNIYDEADDSADWESLSDGETEDVIGRRNAIPPLLPAPLNLSSAGDKLCDTCKALNLSPERFVVLPSDREYTNKPDEANISLGLVENILAKSNCPFCRLVLVALGGVEDVPAEEDGDPVEVVMSWTTAGRVPDVNQPWHHIPQIRLLRPYAQRVGGGFVRSRRLNLFPEITLLANDAPTSSKAFFVRPIQSDQIDFSMVRNWISMCQNWHGQSCNTAKLKDHETRHPTEDISTFRLIDVIDNCLVHRPPKSKYVALSYVWGKATVFRTLKNNLADLEKPGSFSQPEILDQIPWSIRDAMQVVKELGLRYLWVDSICIVQDDPACLDDSISRMDLVYGAAYLTIMAATGSHANAGLPGVRPGTRGQRQPIEEIAPGFRLAFKPLYQNHIKDSTYYTRAWT